MKIIIGLLIFIIVGFILGPLVQNIPGSVHILLTDKSIQFPLWIALIFFVLFFVGTVFVIHLYRYTTSGLSSITGKSQNKKNKLAIVHINNAFLAYIKGEFEEMNKWLIKSSMHPQLNFLSHLYAAKLAQFQLDITRRDKCLIKAAEIKPDKQFIVDLFKADLLIQEGNNIEAWNILSQLKDQRNKKAINLMLDVGIKLKRWDECFELLLLSKKLKMTECSKDFQFYERVVSGVLERFQTPVDLNVLNQFWKKVPKEVTKEEPVFLQYIECLFRLGDKKTAQKLLVDRIKKHESINGAALYLTLDFGDKASQLLLVENSKLEMASHEKALLSLVKITCDLNYWGKARDYCESLLALNSKIDYLLIMSKILSELDQADRSLIFYQKALKQLN